MWGLFCLFVFAFVLDKQQLQAELAEHQVPVEKLQKATRDLIEIEGEPALDHRPIQETTGMKQQQYSHLFTVIFDLQYIAHSVNRYLEH